MLVLGFTGKSRLLLDLSLLSMLLLDSESELSLDFSLLSMLLLGFSFMWPELLTRFSNLSSLSWMSSWLHCNFSTAEMNFLRWIKYSGYSSKLQWFPPLSHKGSYLCLQSSHSCFPWEKSTTSSSVPCIEFRNRNSDHKWQHLETKTKKQSKKCKLTWITITGQLTSGILSIFCTKGVKLEFVGQEELGNHSYIEIREKKNLINVKPEGSFDMIHDSQAREDRTVKYYSSRFGQANCQIQSRSTPNWLSIQHYIFFFHSIFFLQALISSFYVCICILFTWLLP